MAGYVARLTDRRLGELMAAQAAVMVTGTRACGKTTSAVRHVVSVARLDEPRVAVAFAADPDVALGALATPALIDEWQVLPEVLGAVKRAVDASPERGRFIVTGSTAASARLPQWQATGRLVDLRLYPMTVAELTHRTAGPGLGERLLSGDGLAPSGDGEDLGDYLDWALRGGFPEAALHLEGQNRVDWLDGYARRLVTRDIPEVEGPRNPEALGRFLQAVCLNSAGVVNDTTLAGVSGVSAITARAYDAALRNALVVDALPAWFSNRLSRLTKTAKRYVCDTALMCAVAGVSRSALLRDGDLLGRVIETFVVAQVRADLAARQPGARLYHLRDQEGRHEVDLIVEFDASRVVGIEIKASAAPTRTDARHLVWLRDQLGDRFVRGVVLHTGPYTFDLADGIIAAPISTLWAPPVGRNPRGNAG